MIDSNIDPIDHPHFWRIGHCASRPDGEVPYLSLREWLAIELHRFHCDALSIDTFAKAYATKGAAAYVQLIQREERNNGVETLTHQKWSGSEIVDEMGNVV